MVDSTTETTEYLYEGMFLLDSGKFATDPGGAADAVLGILEKNGGTVVAHRPWQDGKLAYPIEGHRKGMHYLTYFRMSGATIGDLARDVKLNELVLRHLVIRQSQTIFDAGVAALSGTGEETNTGEEITELAETTTGEASDEPSSSE